MTKEQLLETILFTSYSKVDVFRRIRLWRSYLEKEFFANGNATGLEGFLQKESVGEHDIKIILSWGKEFYDSFTKENAYEYTDVLLESIKHIPTVTLYIPFEPTQKDLSDFGTWFRKNVDTFMLLDIHTDAAAFGGCAFAIDGVFHDYSLRNRLELHTTDIHDLLGKFAMQ